MIAAVAFPITIDGMYDYLVPSAMEETIRRGMPVKVSLRNRELWGVVVALKEVSEFAQLKEILDIKGEQWSEASESLMQLYQWIAEYYQAPLGKVFRPIVKKSLANKKAKEVLYYTITSYTPSDLTIKQQEIRALLSPSENLYRIDDLKRLFNLSSYMIKTFEAKGILRRVEKVELRESAESTYDVVQSDGKLSQEQQAAFDTIIADASRPTKPFLLHGITGSGKTHVYIAVAQSVLSEGKGVIILVPEIALTPQTIGRISAELSEPVAVMHSRMSDGERRDSLEQIVSGQRRVVIGVRSAILVPMVDIGLIVVDEEHDGSYKQSDPEPRYHARDVAIMRGKLQKALVILGSATPSIETYYNAQQGKYHLITLHNRFGEGKLPQVHIINMHSERATGKFTPLSARLEKALHATMQKGDQAVLLLNRRGFATTLKCSSCEATRQCPHCAVNLVYHRSGDSVVCHHCGYKETPSYTCDSCGGSEVHFEGMGIQKVESYLSEAFPTYRVLRMDQDTTAKKGGHLSIIEAFENREADILLGTQMVAKGLNFPAVSLVGVLQADIGLSLPDFRAGERLFQLLTQVAGRAGRTNDQGEVFIQTYTPDDPAIVAAKKHDYTLFYQETIAERKEVSYPPFVRLVRIMVSGKNEERVAFMAESIGQFLEKQDIDSVQVLGPVEALFSRLKGEFRYTLLLKSSSYKELFEVLYRFDIEKSHTKGPLKIKVDVDPIQVV